MQVSSEDFSLKIMKIKKCPGIIAWIFFTPFSRFSYDKIIRGKKMTIVCIKAPRFLGAILKLFVRKKSKTQ